MASRAVKQLASSGQYVEAGVLADAEARAQAELRAQREQRLADEQATQLRLFERAERDLARRRAEAAAAHERQRLDRTLTLGAERERARQEELELYAVREATRLSRRPVVCSAKQRDLEQQGYELATDQRFYEAAVLQDLAARTATTDGLAALDSRSAELARTIERHAHQQRARDYAFEKSHETKLRREAQREAEEFAREEARLAHMKREMLAAHDRQRVLLQQRGAPDADPSRVLASKAARGTLLERRVVGGQYDIPSLCDMYGSALDHGVGGAV